MRSRRTMGYTCESDILSDKARVARTLLPGQFLAGEGARPTRSITRIGRLSRLKVSRVQHPQEDTRGLSDLFTVSNSLAEITDHRTRHWRQCYLGERSTHDLFVSFLLPLLVCFEV